MTPDNKLVEAQEKIRGAAAFLESTLRTNSRDLDDWRMDVQDAVATIRAALSQPVPSAPIDMVLHCPKCGKQHIDWAEPAVEHDHGAVEFVAWDNPPHRSHLCHNCGHIWRPADVPTNGVAAVKTKGKEDSPIAVPSAPEPSQKYDDTLLPFLALMRRELHANSRKGDRPGWLTMSREVGLLEIYWHTAKLSAAVKNNDAAAISEHCADVANMAMMLLDVCGGLGIETQKGFV